MTTITRRRAVQLGSAAALAVLTGPSAVRARQNAPVYTFVVAGLDYREGHEEHNNDVLMISRVDTGQGTVRTVSIPRDLYVELPGFGGDKITRAFHTGYSTSGETWDGGAQLLADTVALNFGQAIDGVATTTFAGFERIIDALGGLVIDNPYEVVDPEFEPLDPGNWSWPAGPQTLSGASALRFVRTRKMDGDEGRVMRQQLVLTAILAELQKPEIVSELPALVESVRDTVDTNIPTEVQLQLMAMLPTLDRANVAFLNVADQLVGGTLPSGMWVYQADWSTLPGYIEAYLSGQL